MSCREVSQVLSHEGGREGHAQGLILGRRGRLAGPWRSGLLAPVLGSGSFFSPADAMSLSTASPGSLLETSLGAQLRSLDLESVFAPDCQEIHMHTEFGKNWATAVVTLALVGEEKIFVNSFTVPPWV